MTVHIGRLADSIDGPRLAPLCGQFAEGDEIHSRERGETDCEDCEALKSDLPGHHLRPSDEGGDE